MNTEAIHNAIEVLHLAATALRRGHLSIEDQVKLGGECDGAAYQLLQILREHKPEARDE